MPKKKMMMMMKEKEKEKRRNSNLHLIPDWFNQMQIKETFQIILTRRESSCKYFVYIFWVHSCINGKHNHNHQCLNESPLLKNGTSHIRPCILSISELSALLVTWKRQDDTSLSIPRNNSF